jgi:copper(I)-binding protein
MRLSFAATFAALALAGAAHAVSYQGGGYEVNQAWSRPVAAGTNGAGYMSITNHAKTADTLKSVETPVARKVEIHTTTMTNGVMSMKRRDAGLPIGAGETVTFSPGGNHLMLIGMTSATKAGDQIPLTLVFASGTRIKMNFLVGNGPTSATAAPMAGMEHMKH